MSTTTSTSSDSTEVVTLALEAYQTAVFHALKHEHCVVSGLLLGTATPAGWTVARAVPLFRDAPGMDPAELQARYEPVRYSFGRRLRSWDDIRRALEREDER